MIGMRQHLTRQRRKFVRIKAGSLLAEVQILRVANIGVESGKKKVAIVDISPGGLRFLTDLLFPLHAGIALGFDIPFLKLNFRLAGVPVWSRLTENVREYGVCFVLTGSQQIELNRRINHWMESLLPRQLEILQLYRGIAAEYEARFLGGRFDRRI